MLAVVKSRQVFLRLISVWILLLVFSTGIFSGVIESKSKIPGKVLLSNYPTIKQLRNYCGPASLACVLNYWGQETDQKTIGKTVYDPLLQATNGAHMLLYARDLGYSSYSWNSNLNNLKQKLADGVPVIVLQDISLRDNSGHFRVAVGYDDEKQVIHVMDPYEVDQTTIPYATFNKLWRPHGNWSLLVVPEPQDKYKKELDYENPVVHIDMAYAYYSKGKLNKAAESCRKVLDIEPRNPDALALSNKVNRDLQYAAGKKEKQNKK